MTDRRRALVVALGLYALATAVLLFVSTRFTSGALVFPLDDVYIHFAIARTLVEHGTYGLQPGDFSTPSSSIAWPFLLAAGGAAHVPFAVVALAASIAAGAASLWIVEGALGDDLTWSRRIVSLALVGLAVPLVPMAALGMEHSVHIACILALVACAERRASPWVLAAVAAAAASFRYETAFVVVPLAMWLAWQRRWRDVLALSIGAALPVVVAAAIFRAHGAPAFPLSVVLKRTHLALGELGPVVLRRFVEHPHVPALLVASLFVLSPKRPWLACGIFALMAQTVFAQLGWFYRYESYAVAVVSVGLVTAVPSRAALRALVIVVLAPLWLRSAYAHGALPKAARNVAEQQRTMASFIAQVAPPGAVAVNDVGAVAYYGGARVLDLMGLSDLRVARARGFRIDRPLPVPELERLAAERGVTMAILYEPWFAGALPASWVPLERWRIRDNRVCAFDTVTVMAAGPAEAARLRAALAAFRTRLPDRVEALPIEKD